MSSVDPCTLSLLQMACNYGVRTNDEIEVHIASITLRHRSNGFAVWEFPS